MARDPAIEAHYDRHPYPGSTTLVIPRDPRHAVGTLDYLLRRRADRSLGPRMRVWIAGCGTLQGARWGRMLPDARILATDVSARTLELASEVADAAGVTNARFERGDLHEAPGEPFDLIVCTGVVHHLDDPPGALRALRDRLEGDTPILLMVYHRAHRGPLDPIRRAARLLSPDLDPDVALRLLAASLDPRCRPVDRDMVEELIAMRERDPSFLADLLVNPRERAYDIDGVLGLLEAAGLRFASWQYPGAHRLRNVCADEALVMPVEARAPLDEARVAHAVMGLAAPMLQLLAVRDDAEAPRPYSEGERLAMPMLAQRETEEVVVERGAETSTRRVPTWRVDGDWVRGAAASGPGAGREWAVPRAALAALERFDGTRSGVAIADELGVAPDALLSLIDALSPDDAGLLAPAF